MCGIAGIYDENNFETANLMYFALMALQHRGQDSAGISVSHGGFITGYKDTGLIQDIFDKRILSILRGDMCLGHVKYSNGGQNKSAVAQPYTIQYEGGTMAVAINGALTNSSELRARMKKESVKLETDTDCELIAALIALKYKKAGPEANIISAIRKSLNEIEGAFALGIMADQKLICARDKSGIRPLCLGKFTEGNGHVFASESVAFDIIGAEFVSEVEPGEIAIISKNGIDKIKFAPEDKKENASVCAFEFVYFARPDSNMNGVSVYKARENAGRRLAREHPVEADCVIGVPDSGSPAAIGFAAESGIPNRMGLIKNRYVGRSFIEPTQVLRELAVKIKLNPIKDIVEGKRVVLIDDSIVRGTTSMKLVQLLRSAGASEVHMRISSPEIKELCPYGGIDIDDKNNLISSKCSVEDVRKRLGADSLGFLSLEGLMEALVRGTHGYCDTCLGGVGKGCPAAKNSEAKKMSPPSLHPTKP